MVLRDIRKVMYVLPQAGQLTYKKLVQHLQTGGYTPVEQKPRLFKHNTNAITFCLAVNDFGIKCVHKNEAQNLMDYLNKIYKTMVDWDGKLFCRLHLKLD